MPYSPAHLDNFINDAVARISRWFKKAKPEPSFNDFTTQLGVHFEEISEMISTFKGTDRLTQSMLTAALVANHSLALHLKAAKGEVLLIEDRTELLDSLCDQIVTAVGVGVFGHMDVTGALCEVSDSNDSKFDPATGLPILNEHGKIMKGPAYRKADLAPFI